jgi:hypothetical protein
MQYVVSKTEQIAVEADNPSDAVKAALNNQGTVISVNFGANPRPQPVLPQTPVQTGVRITS